MNSTNTICVTHTRTCAQDYGEYISELRTACYNEKSTDFEVR